MRFNIFTLIFLLLSNRAQALTASDLKTGDVLLQSVPCYICSLIEIEEGAPYSHSGVAWVANDGSVSMNEVWVDVDQIPLSDFLAKRKAQTQTLVLRAIANDGSDFVIDPESLQTLFNQNFLGHSYDEDFLWNNSDSKGEMYYCSELIAKLLNYFLPNPITTKPMHFTHYREDWIKYFHGTPPDGQPGLSPADFTTMKQFRTVGEI